MSTKLNVKPSDQIFPRLGSFWNDRFGQRALARSLAQLASDRQRAPDQLYASIGGLLGAGTTAAPTGPISVKVDLKKARRTSVYTPITSTPPTS